VGSLPPFPRFFPRPGLGLGGLQVVLSAVINAAGAENRKENREENRFHDALPVTFEFCPKEE
jgi:hypothetical protein